MRKWSQWLTAPLFQKPWHSGAHDVAFLDATVKDIEQHILTLFSTADALIEDRCDPLATLNRFSYIKSIVVDCTLFRSVDSVVIARPDKMLASPSRNTTLVTPTLSLQMRSLSDLVIRVAKVSRPRSVCGHELGTKAPISQTLFANQTRRRS